MWVQSQKQRTVKAHCARVQFDKHLSKHSIPSFLSLAIHLASLWEAHPRGDAVHQSLQLQQGLQQQVGLEQQTQGPRQQQSVALCSVLRVM